MPYLADSIEYAKCRIDDAEKLAVCSKHDHRFFKDY